MEKRPPLSRPKTSSGSRPGTAFRRPKTAGKSLFIYFNYKKLKNFRSCTHFFRK